MVRKTAMSRTGPGLHGTNAQQHPERLRINSLSKDLLLRQVTGQALLSWKTRTQLIEIIFTEKMKKTLSHNERVRRCQQQFRSKYR